MPLTVVDASQAQTKIQPNILPDALSARTRALLIASSSDRSVLSTYVNLSSALAASHGQYLFQDPRSVHRAMTEVKEKRHVLRAEAAGLTQSEIKPHFPAENRFLVFLAFINIEA
jgi:hypothetical protein